jgi:hypothetical protein
MTNCNTSLLQKVEVKIFKFSRDITISSELIIGNEIYIYIIQTYELNNTSEPLLKYLTIDIVSKLA